MEDKAVRSRAYVFFTGKHGKTHIRFTDVFHGGMLPGSGYFELMIQTLFDVQDEDDFSFKMLGFNEKYYGYPDFKINTLTFNDFFGYVEEVDDLIAPLGSISDGNRDIKDIEVNFSATHTVDVELLFVMNFASKDLFLEGHNHQSVIVPKWGMMKDSGWAVVPGYKRRVCAIHNHKALLGKRSQIYPLSSLEQATVLLKMWGCDTRWDVLATGTP